MRKSINMSSITSGLIPYDVPPQLTLEIKNGRGMPKSVELAAVFAHVGPFIENENCHVGRLEIQPKNPSKLGVPIPENEVEIGM
jgi:hypothetical protein